MTADAARTILSGDLKHLNDKLSQHAQADQLKRMLARGVFSKLFFPNKHPTRLDRHLTPSLEMLQLQFEELCVNDDSFFTNGTHPLRQVFETLLKLGSTWYSRESKASQIFFEKISELIESAIEWIRESQLSNSEKPKPTKLLKALADFIHWANSEAKRAELLEERLCESELSHLSLIAAENYAIEAINSTFAKIELPTDLAMRLNTHLKNCLQNAYLKDTANSNFLRKWQQLSPLLRKIFSARQESADLQELYRDIPVAINELELSIPLATGAQDTYAEFVALLNHRLMQIVQQQDFETFPFAPLLQAQENLISQPGSLLQKNIESLKVGDWFMVQSAQTEWIRCKLALINQIAGCLLFVDSSGRKVMLKNFAEFSTLITVGDARPLQPVSIEQTINDGVSQLLTKLTSKNSELKDATAPKISTAQQAASLKAKAEANALAQQQLNTAPLESQKIETPQNEILKESSAEIPAKTQTAENLEDINTADFLPEELCREKIQTLSLGAWVDFETETGTSQRLKLAVVIAGAGKYIFVDELGRKQGEYIREQLIDLMQRNCLQIISSGEKFEDQLVKVIRGLRKDIS